MKWSPPRAVTPNPSVKSSKTKCSGGKSGPHRSSGHSSNTSTLKHPNSTSAKKSSSSKKPASNKQEKSPRACGKCGHSPSPSAKSVRHKWKDVCTEDTHTLNSTLPISSSIFDGLCSPMGAHSYVTKLLSPSITSTPWVLAVLDNGKLCQTKVGTHWLQFIPAQASTFPDTLQEDLAT